MKKLIIGLLVIAAGAGAFIYFQNKKQSSAENPVPKELVIGKWKMESVKAVNDSMNNFLAGIISTTDSNTFKYGYEFTKDGNIFRSLGDSVTKDGSRYEWDKKNQLVWKESATDSTGTALQISKLNKDSLLVQSPDSVIVLFTKLK